MGGKIIKWYISSEAAPYWCVLLMDSLIMLVSGFLAYIFNHEQVSDTGTLADIFLALLAYMPCYLIGFRLMHTYNGLIRQSTFEDLMRIAKALLFAIILIMAMRVCLDADRFLLPIRMRDLLLQALIAMTVMSGIRVLVKQLYDWNIRHCSKNGVYGLSSNLLLDMEMNNLLPRNPIDVDMETISSELEGKSILVTGAAGSIGSELSWLLASFRPGRLILVDQAETPLHDVRLRMQREWKEVSCVTIVSSICHSYRMENIFSRYRPDVIFHAAAYKHVPMMEDNPTESILNNVDGTRKLADLATKYEVKKFVMISTDKAVNPTSVMGCSKRICEVYCQSLALAHKSGCQFITTRFGNVLGSNGSVIPIFREQIKRGGPLLVTHPEITRFFMLIPEACRLVLEAATIGHGGEIFAFDMGQPVRIIDLAKRMIRLSGRHDIQIKFTGLRPGEKLYEEVLNDEETVIPTSHPKIKVAKVREYDYETISGQINELIGIAHTCNQRETVQMMKRIIPEYQTHLLE